MRDKVDTAMYLLPLRSTDFHLISSWFKNDAAGRRYLSSYATPKGWINSLGPNRFGWVVHGADRDAIGFVDLEVVRPQGYFTIYLEPRARKHGRSLELLNELEKEAANKGVRELVAYVEEDNVNSCTALAAAGFVATGRDEDRLVRWSRPVPDAQWRREVDSNTPDG